MNDNKSTVNTPEENATAAAAAHVNAQRGVHDRNANGGAADAKSAADSLARRVIKRYSNRKLYDTQDSRYVTLLQIAEMVRSGEEVQIIDNNSKEDLTEVTLAQIIYEEQKAHSRSVPLQTLKELIHQRTEKVLTELREGPIGRLLPGEPRRAERRARGRGARYGGFARPRAGQPVVAQRRSRALGGRGADGGDPQAPRAGRAPRVPAQQPEILKHFRSGWQRPVAIGHPF